jgi:enterobactin synthetase component D
VSLEPSVVSVPRILPAWASQLSFYLDEVHDAAAGISLPPAYRIASPERQRTYRAGRYCAQRALEQLGLSRVGPGVRDSGGPEWPIGVVGSITHATTLVSVAVALHRQVEGIGIDIEPTIPFEKAHRLAPRAAASAEVFGVMNAAHLDYATAIAVIVSAKHSLYKCLQPVTGRSFGYLDLSIDDIGSQSGRFRARLKTALSQQWLAGTVINGQVEVVGNLIYTGVYC